MCLLPQHTICKLAPQFEGTAQQDSQELLAFLMDGLHEDLNRVYGRAKGAHCIREEMGEGCYWWEYYIGEEEGDEREEVLLARILYEGGERKGEECLCVLLAKVLHGEGGGKEKGKSAGGGNTARGRKRVGKEEEECCWQKYCMGKEGGRRRRGVLVVGILHGGGRG